MGSRRKARITAFQTVYAWEENKTNKEELLSFSWLKQQLEEDVLAFAAYLAGGTIDNLEEIDAAIKSCLKRWSFDRLARVDLALLRISVYALLYPQDIPPSVTINEAVEIAKSYGTPHSPRFVNGVLDAVRRRAPS